MQLPAVLYSVRWLIHDTFRQALASGICWLMLGVSILCTCVCLTVGVEGDTPLRSGDEPPAFLPRQAVNQATPAEAATLVTLGPVAQAAVLQADRRPDARRARLEGVAVVSGKVTILFGAMRVPLGRDAHDAVFSIQLLLAGGVADAAGILLALVWTAGFLPAFLDPSAAAVLLAKPMPRWVLLLGKYLGVLVFVGFQAMVFVGSTWLALALRTGVWDSTYWLCVPILLMHFAIFYSFSVLLAVSTRSTVACIFGSILFWLVCWAMNYGRHAVVALPDLATMPDSLLGMIEAGYWVLPKPADLGILLASALHADDHFSQLFEFQAVQSRGKFDPELSILSSLAFTLAILASSAYEFVTTDY